MNYRIILTGFVFIFSISSAMANVRMPKLFSDNMVVQHGEKIKVWGWAEPGEKIKVTFAGKNKSAKAGKDGTWDVTFSKMIPGGPFNMIITGKNEINLKNIMIGDVWICSGQSNMEWPLLRTNGAKEEIATAKYPNIRIFTADRNVQFQPADDLKGGEWKVCTPLTIPEFSAVGYYFGKEIQQTQNIPVGLISTNWGGTESETWTSRESCLLDPVLKQELKNMDKFDIEASGKEMKARYAPILEELKKSPPGLVNGKAIWVTEPFDSTKWRSIQVPGLWEKAGYDGMNGIVWFRKVVNLSKEAASQGMILNLGPIDDSDWTWVNGVKVGETIQKYNQPRSYLIDSSVLKPGENVIMVRCEDTGGGGGIWGKPEQLSLAGKEFNVSLAGEWLFRISPTDFALDPVGAGPNDFPTLLFNGMIHPLLNAKVKGVIWYQGENNAKRAFQYRTIFPLMINDWRTHWKNDDLYFFTTQLANFGTPVQKPGPSDWAELREAQNLSLQLPKTGIAVTIDIGEAHDIHPRNKADVGHRLALAARKITYGEQELVHSGPMYHSMLVEGDRAIISFSEVGSGLVVKDRYGYVKGFTIAGADKKFYWAQAEIEGDRVSVYSPHVEQPVAVRYGWANNPDDVNLFNKEGLPASPFRTDDWPGMTDKAHLSQE